MGEEEQRATNGGYTVKEMVAAQGLLLTKMDEKLDALAGRQMGIEVEFAILKAQVHQNQKDIKEKADVVAIEDARLAADLVEQRAKMDSAVAKIQVNQLSVMKLVKWATAVLGGALIGTDILIRFFTK
jgi:hypothetical protein